MTSRAIQCSKEHNSSSLLKCLQWPGIKSGDSTKWLECVWTPRREMLQQDLTQLEAVGAVFVSDAQFFVTFLHLKTYTLKCF